MIKMCVSVKEKVLSANVQKNVSIITILNQKPFSVFTFLAAAYFWIIFLGEIKIHHPFKQFLILHYESTTKMLIFIEIHWCSSWCFDWHYINAQNQTLLLSLCSLIVPFLHFKLYFLQLLISKQDEFEFKNCSTFSKVFGVWPKSKQVSS